MIVVRLHRIRRLVCVFDFAVCAMTCYQQSNYRTPVTLDLQHITPPFYR